MSIETATVLYKAADHTAALKQALTAIDGPDGGAALLIAAKCLLALGNFEGLGKVMAVAAQSGAAPERTLFRIEHDCLADGLYLPLIALDRMIPEASPLHPIALYHASCARMMLGDEERAAQGFDKFRLGLPRFLGSLPFGTDDEFNTMFRQGTLVLPPERTAERLAEGAVLPAAQAGIEIVRPLRDDGGGPVIMCAADARYIEHFLRYWLPPVLPLARPAHVHVVNPDPGSVALIDGLIAEHGLDGRLSVSVSVDARATATSYACARFEIIPVLLRRLGRPLIALDIDVAATPALDALAGAPFEADFGGFETGRAEPASVHQASIMCFADTDAAVDFAGDLAAYCRPKLHQPVRVNWMLDQAALFSVIRLYRRTKPDFRYLALDQSTGHPLQDYICGLASDEEKHAIKVKSAGLGADADPSGRVEFTWEP